MPDEFASPLDAILWGVGTAHEIEPQSLSELQRRAISVNGGREVHMSFETVFTAYGHPFDHIQPRGMLQVDRSSHGRIELLRIKDAEGQWALAAVETRHKNVYHILSGLPMTSPRSKKVDRWFARSREVSRCFLNHDDFAAIGDHLAEWGQVEVVKWAGRMVLDGSSMNRGFPALDDAYRPNHRDALQEVEHHGGAIRTLTLHISGIINVHLRRISGATLYSGSVGVLEATVLDRLSRAASERRSLFIDRHRRSITEEMRPLEISLPSEAMKGREETETLLNEVQQISGIAVAVFHRNPYFHVVVTDEVDGSNFDVVVTRSDAIDVYPGYRASAEAFARLAQTLGERFGARELSQRRARENVSMFDLVEG